MDAPPRIAILLSTYQGARFLAEQLESLRAQSHRDWVLYWRDDGSSDMTVELMRAFRAAMGDDRVVTLDATSRLGAAGSFMCLLRRAYADGHAMAAFADQDDVWLAEKLARAAAALSAEPDDAPALYFTRQILVDDQLRRIGVSPRVRRPPGFPACLTQNLATGCTMVMNRPAMARLADTTPPAGVLHDWWCYIVIAASGGHLLADPEPAVLYRQHASNAVGARANPWRRAVAALRRGRGAYIGTLRASVAALLARPDLTTVQAHRQVLCIAKGLDLGIAQRLRALCLPGFRRQGLAETMLFRVWFLLG